MSTTANTLTHEERFIIQKQLGQGSFSTIYQAFDNQRCEQVALKVEKADKSKRILWLEYETLRHLQGLSRVPKVYEFIKQSEQTISQPGYTDQENNQNFIVMQLLGHNLANQKKILGTRMSTDIAVNYLIQMLDAIEQIHNRGFIHRDIKPSNFVVGKDENFDDMVIIVDFGLAKLHLDHQGNALPMRPNVDFRGTITFASLNAHLKIDLSRRDDLWSFFFVILDFLNENIPWKSSIVKDEVREFKSKCLEDPDKYLWTSKTLENPEIIFIFKYIKTLKFEDKPDYEFIRSQLKQIQNNYLNSRKHNEQFSEIIQNQRASTKSNNQAQIKVQTQRILPSLQHQIKQMNMSKAMECPPKIPYLEPLITQRQQCINSNIQQTQYIQGKSQNLEIIPTPNKNVFIHLNPFNISKLENDVRPQISTKRRQFLKEPMIINNNMIPLPLNQQIHRIIRNEPSQQIGEQFDFMSQPPLFIQETQLPKIQQIFPQIVYQYSGQPQQFFTLIPQQIVLPEQIIYHSPAQIIQQSNIAKSTKKRDQKLTNKTLVNQRIQKQISPLTTTVLPPAATIVQYTQNIFNINNQQYQQTPIIPSLAYPNIQYCL